MRSSFRLALLCLASIWIAGCVPSYSLVKPAPVKVAASSLEVRPTSAWNRAPSTPNDVKQKERWTHNGLTLDAISFIGGLKDGTAIVKQHKKAAQKVPPFRSTMGPQDLVSMIEAFYRIEGVSVFETQGIKPVKFVGEHGVQFDYAFVGADEVKRRGRAVMAISSGKLYLMNLNGAAVHYFDAALPEFEALVASARVPGKMG